MKNVMLVAGEASGDQHGAEIVTHLKQTAHCFGIGGRHMQAAGMEILFDAAQIAVMGFIEVLKHFPAISQAWKVAKHAIDTQKPDLLILIDYPGFNLRLARYAKQQGIKVLYYISPQVWAWRQNRVYTIKQCVDHMAVIFPFEVPFHEKAHVPVTFVGSPLVEQVQPIGNAATAAERLELPNTKTLIGLLPGSRHSELERLLPTMVASAQLLRQHDPNIHFVLPVASTLKLADFMAHIAPIEDAVTLVEQDTHVAIEACHAVICSSGTATLETALLQTPMVVIYKTSALTYSLAKRLIRIPHIALCNIVAGKAIVQEYIQDAAKPEAISQEIIRLLSNENYLKQMKMELAKIAEKLGEPGAAEKVAHLAKTLLTRE